MYLYTKNLDAKENPQLLPPVCDTAVRLARVSSLFVASPCRVYSKGPTGVHSIVWLREGPVFGLAWLGLAWPSRRCDCWQGKYTVWLHISDRGRAGDETSRDEAIQGRAQAQTG